MLDEPIDPATPGSETTPPPVNAVQDQITALRGMSNEDLAAKLATAPVPAVPVLTLQNPPDGEDVPPLEGEAPPAEERPRRPDGTFLPKEEAPPAEGAPPAGDPAPGEPVVVKIPGQRPGEFEEIEVTDAKVAERLRQLANGAMRREEFNNRLENVNRLRDEMQEFMDRLSHDPANLLLDSQVDPERRVELARHLISDPGVWNALAEELGTWVSDEGARRTRMAELRADRLEAGRRADQTISSNRQRAAHSRSLMGAVNALVPDGSEHADRFLRDATADLSRHIRETGRAILPAEVPEILAFRLRQYGFTAPARPASAPPASPATPARAPARPAVTAAQAGKTLTAQARRAAAAATPAGGVGGIPAAQHLPAGQTLQERFAYLKKNLGQGQPA